MSAYRRQEGENNSRRQNTGNVHRPAGSNSTKKFQAGKFLVPPLFTRQGTGSSNVNVPGEPGHVGTGIWPTK
jgi:hypothetical protein